MKFISSIRHSVTSNFYNFEHNNVFTEEEGWMLFRIAAIAEACGWSLLITGIIIERYVLPGNQAPIIVAGRIHGILFLMYATAAGLYPTLGWSRKRAFVALMASVPPFGSLIFEWWVSLVRQNSQFKICRRCVLLNIIGEN